MKPINKVIQASLKSVIVIALSFSFFYACNVSTAKLSDMKVCTAPAAGSGCESNMSTVPADAPKVVCTANLKNAPDDTKVTFTWSLNGEKIASADVKSGSSVVSSTLTSPGTLAPGTYTVTAKIDSDNSEPVKTEFKVE